MATGELLHGSSGALIYGASGTLLYSTSGGTRADSVCFDYARYGSGILQETVSDCMNSDRLPIYYLKDSIVESLAPQYKTLTSSVFLYKDGQTTRPDIAPTGITVEIYDATTQGGALLDTITYLPTQASRTIGGVTYYGWFVTIPSAATLYAQYGDFTTHISVEY